MFQSAIQMFVNIDQYEQLENLPKVAQGYWDNFTEPLNAATMVTLNSMFSNYHSGL